jgi:ATP-binding cassette subfamily C protein
VTENILWIASRSFSRLSKREKLVIAFYSFAQIILNFLDLVGVALIGILGSISVAGLEGKDLGTRASNIFKFLGISSFTLQKQALILATAAVLLLILKTLLSVILMRRSLVFLGLRGAKLTEDLVSKFLRRDILEMHSHSSQDFWFTLSRGADAATMGVLGTLITLISDSTLLLLMFGSLFYVDPLMAIISILMFGGVALALYFSLQARTRRLGAKSNDITVEFSERLIELYFSFREIFVNNRSDYYVNSIGRIRRSLAETNAEITFLPNISKYFFESLLLLGTLLIAGIQFSQENAQHAVGTLAVYFAASSRIAPAIMRIQQGFLQIKSNQDASYKALKWDLELSRNFTDQDFEVPDRSIFQGNAELSDVSLRYRNSETAALKDINLIVKEGEFLAIVGPSGSGKSSLSDILLGVITPTSGSSSISGESSSIVTKRFPGLIGYVPQEVFIANGTVRSNLELGFLPGTYTDEEMFTALQQASLGDFADSSSSGLNYLVGERGNKLSGGQRQRLGIARALITNPRFLVLDEASSALDAQAENEIAQTIAELKRHVTLVVIAHRLSTVLKADRIVYLENGRLLAQGTFEEVRSKVPDFDSQARLMGLQSE